MRTPRFNSRSGIDRDEAARERRLAASLNVVADGVLSPSGNVADLPLTGDTMLAVLQGGKLLSATVDDVGDVIGGGGISASAVMVRGLGC